MFDKKYYISIRFDYTITFQYMSLQNYFTFQYISLQFDMLNNNITSQYNLNKTTRFLVHVTIKLYFDTFHYDISFQFI